MKQTKQLLTLAAALLATLWLAGCGNTATEQTADTTAVDSATCENTTGQAAAATPVVTWQSVIDEYLTTEIGARLRQDNGLIIPSYTVIAVDSSEGNVYRVWGDWWVGVYSDSKNTLYTSLLTCAPGLFTLQKTTDGFKITQFDEVEEGRAFDENAERVFGKYCDAFWKVNRDEAHLDSIRLVAVSEYVRKHNLPYTKVQINDIDLPFDLK